MVNIDNDFIEEVKENYPKNADKIIVLTDEGIVEEGSHAELIEKNGIYAGLYSSYKA